MAGVSGTYKVGRGFSVEFPAVWNDITGNSLRLPWVRTFTREGPSLDIMLLTDGIPPGQAMARRVTASDERRGNTQIPVVRAAMNELELVEFVVDSIAAEDYQQIETVDVAPVQVAGEDGVGFGFSARTPAGLNMRGMARALQRANGRVHVLVFLAPEEHYWPRMEAQVRQIFDSARFGS
jgi:hypothetical protein